MITIVLIDLYKKELERLKQEILAYAADDQLWATPPNAIAAGNLCLQLTGSLQHYIGNLIGDSGYIRNKEAELKAKNLSRERLLEEVDNTSTIVVNTLEELSKTELQKVFPTTEFEEPVTTEFYVLHLLKVLGYYLGQIRYHRLVVTAA
ncbi:MAG: DinB superfamily protein [Sphingobacteriales bacterium]|nr:MAG: DinB superfamily protein [Sphingobacteriales bacterium]